MPWRRRMQQQNTIVRRGNRHEEFILALVGTGPTWELLVGILGRGEFAEAFPWIRLAGWVTGDADIPRLLPEPFANTPEYADCAALFAANPDLHMVCDLTPDGSGMAELRRTAPNGVALISKETVLNFCSATAEGTLVIGGGARLRRERSLFSALIDQIEQEVLILDGKGRILDINHHALQMRGGAKADYVGRVCSELEGMDLCCDDESCLYARAIETGQGITERYTKVTPDGRMRYFRLYGFPVGDEKVHAKRLVLMRSDITAHVQIEQRLQQAQKMAAIGELSTYIAHEIRNPLFAIGGFANSLLRTPSLDNGAREKVRIILEESRRLDEILKSIINFARPTDHAVGDVDVNEVAVQTVDLMGIGGEDRHIAIGLDLASDLPKVHGNAEMIKQCLINLVKNAQEALADGGAILVRSRFSGSTVYLEVEDDGPGIPPELHEQVFSPFFSTKDKGSGLGLAMTRKIIGEMGGKVHLASQPGKGTTISLALPPALAVIAKTRVPDHE